MNTDTTLKNQWRSPLGHSCTVDVSLLQPDNDSKVVIAMFTFDLRALITGHPQKYDYKICVSGQAKGSRMSLMSSNLDC